MEKIKKQKAFTLAEVLITIIVVGIVAALTIPTLITNYNKKQYVTQLKKNYNAMSNGFRNMMAKDGVMHFSDTGFYNKVMQLSNGNFSLANLLNSGYEEARKELENNFKILDIRDYSADRGGIYLTDGTIITTFNLYNSPVSCGDEGECTSLAQFQRYTGTPGKLWRKVGEIRFDVNGLKGPNKSGRDTGFSFDIGDDGMLYPQYGVDYAYAHGCAAGVDMSSCGSHWSSNNNMLCDLKSSMSAVNYLGCAARIMEENWKMNY